jgi:hypothetical protein
MNKFNEVYAKIISEMNEKHLIKESDIEETETTETEKDTLATEDDMGYMGSDEGGEGDSGESME